MSSREIKDFCWASRHALMDLVMLEEYNVSNKVGVTNFIEEMSDGDIYDLTMSMLHTDESIHSTMLEHSYKEYLSGKILINEQSFINGRMEYLTEDSDKKSDGINAQKIINIAVTGSIAQAATQYFLWTLKDPPAAKAARGEISKGLGSRWDNAIKKIPRLHKMIYPEEYTRQKLTKETLKGSAKKLTSAQKKKIEEEVQKAVGDSKVVKGRKWFKRQIDKIIEDPEVTAQKKEAAKKLKGEQKSNNGKVVLAVAGIVALTALAYTIYKYYTDAARKSCNNLRGNNRKICILTFRINAATAAIKKLEEGLPACEEKNNPEKCKYSIQKEIWHWKQRREKYQNQLAKLNQARAKLHK